MNMNNLTYRVMGINQTSQILKVAREDFIEGICLAKFVNTSLDSNLFDLGFGYQIVPLLYGCSSYSSTLSDCLYNGGFNLSGNVEFGNGILGCYSTILVPLPISSFSEIRVSMNSTRLEEILKEGFDLQWKMDMVGCEHCVESRGNCGYDSYLNETTCFCENEDHGSKFCSSSTKKEESDSVTKNKKQKIVQIGIFVGVACIALLACCIFVFIRQKKLAKTSKDLSISIKSKGISTSVAKCSPSTPHHSLKSDLDKGSRYFGVQVFSYAELEQATENFDPKREIGYGGFGTVYYGELQDGRAVAVKLLYEKNFKRVERFMNEVEILTRLRHQNLVTLYGCTSRQSPELLIVYEYIPNGTVADHLHGNRSNSGMLTWPLRLKIALETAEAIAYLHATDIIHRDVKTNNILLDNEFRVKVADFGLSRLFPTDVTHVSTAPQGTPGYVDPEYYQCYQLTDKSDVYSFGVVLIELISAKQAVDTNRHRHDINLSNMAINKIQNHTLHELVDPLIGYENDCAVRRMVTSVAELAFRCLQEESDMRPSMEEVLEALREIQNEEMNAQKPEVVDIVVDRDGILKSNPPPVSPE